MEKLSLLRKVSDGGRMSFHQRFRYNEMAQRYAIYSDLWRKKGLCIREEGYRRPQDALLSVQGVRPEGGARIASPSGVRGIASRCGRCDCDSQRGWTADGAVFRRPYRNSASGEAVQSSY